MHLGRRYHRNSLCQPDPSDFRTFIVSCDDNNIVVWNFNSLEVLRWESAPSLEPLRMMSCCIDKSHVLLTGQIRNLSGHRSSWDGQGETYCFIFRGIISVLLLSGWSSCSPTSFCMNFLQCCCWISFSISFNLNTFCGHMIDVLVILAESLRVSFQQAS